MRTVEIRSYSLRPGSRASFHLMMSIRAVPMQRRWSIDVVTYGSSLHDENSYYLIRSYESVAHRQESQAAFYGSDEWRDGPREKILALIESDASIVLELSEATVEGLRTQE
ncbi:MAG: NIPSNAP family protein [Acidobacteriota bacterium]